VQGFLAGGDANGSKLMAQLVGQAQTKCPNTKVVISGYSQGGQLVHNAAKILNATTAAVVSSGKVLPPMFPLLFHVTLEQNLANEHIKWLSSVIQTTEQLWLGSLRRKRW
jgi:predicted esterase